LAKYLTGAKNLIRPIPKHVSDVRLHVAVVLDSLKAPAWVALVIKEIQGADFADLAQVVIDSEAPRGQQEASNPLFQRYMAWDVARQGSKLDPLFEVDLSNELADIPLVNGASICADVVLWLSSRQPGEVPPEAARFGVWVYRTGEPAGFWELYHREPVTSSCLAVLDGSATPVAIISEQFTATEMGWSVTRNRAVSYWKASALILKSLRQLYENPAALVKSANNGRPPVESPPRTPPNHIHMVRFFLQNATRTIYRNLRYAGRDAYWFVAWRKNREKFVSQAETFHPEGFTAIPAPEGHFYADPFVLENQGRNFIFFEDYLYRERKGVISVLEIDENGQTGETHCVLERPYHLSYPFVFEHEGEIYMIPETFDAHQIELYRASCFPDCWEMVAVLKEDVHAVDTTLWVENGIFYFFTNVATKGTTPNDLLYLFCAESLTGEWYPHPANPLNADVRRSRGAGKLFKRYGKLIRPAQDCSVRYGYACQLNEVKVLSTEEYLEAPLYRIEPNWSPGLIGTHTINSNDRVEVIDGQIYKRKFSSRD
jgi:hypothetical protein